MKKHTVPTAVEAKLPGSQGWIRSIRRHVNSRPWMWLFTAPKPFHPVLLQELQLLSGKPPGAHPAGAVLELKPGELYPLLPVVRSASKIFLIVDTFRAGAVEELYRRVAALPWELLLPTGARVTVKARLEGCRIGHEGAAARTVTEGMGKRMAEAHGTDVPPITGLPGQGSCFSLLLFGLGNRMELRLDISGEHLHKRGYREHVSAAPLRETAAASLLLWYRSIRGPFSTLCDGMCGSGTFPIEAWALAERVPLGGLRSYLLMELPFFSRKSWEWNLNKLRGRVGSFGSTLAIYGSDRDRKSILAAGHNFICASAGLPDFTGDGTSPPRGIHLSQADFFTLEPPPLEEETGKGGSAGARALLVLNPPYGKRLSPREGEETFYTSILRRWEQKWSSWDLLVIVPQELERSLPRLHSKKGARGEGARLAFHNGGIAVAAWILPPPAFASEV